MKSIHRFELSLALLGSLAAATLTAPQLRADANPASPAGSAPSLAWLTDLSLAVKESYDDNVLVVSGLGMPEQSAWVNTVSFKLGVDFAPLLAKSDGVQTLSLVYQPDKVTFAGDSAENYTAHRLNEGLKGKLGSLSYSLDNAFVYVDGNKLAETYAANQLSGAAANQNDKYRNNFSHTLARERRNQDQDRSAATVRWDTKAGFFVRPIASLTYYNMNTYLFNTSKAPYLGYQDYPDRWDVNGGADLGYQLTPNLALTLGYRDGDQHQDQYALAINSDQHFSSNHYQRALLGLEGSLSSWLNVKLSAGPDFRDYNPDTPISDLHTTRFYGEALATATLSNTQSLTFSFKQWLFVSSTGLVPYDDIAYSLVYHLNVTKKLGLDLGAKYLEANYTLGNDLAGSAPSLRDDLDYQGSVGLSYALARHLTGTVGYAYDKGLNGLTSLPANYQPNYRDFEHAVASVGLKYSF